MEKYIAIVSSMIPTSCALFAQADSGIVWYQHLGATGIVGFIIGSALLKLAQRYDQTKDKMIASRDDRIARLEQKYDALEEKYIAHLESQNVTRS